MSRGARAAQGMFLCRSQSDTFVLLVEGEGERLVYKARSRSYNVPEGEQDVIKTREKTETKW